MIARTTSDAGKTTIVTGLCRWLARRGVSVAPFKAQNMSNNSMVCAGGGEIGRAQWIQAVAAGAEPEPAMNPVLLKPGSDRRSHVVVMGEPWGELDARDFTTRRTALAEAAYAAYDDLATRYDVVVCEGAGSPTEINLRASDYVNLGLARRIDAPVLVVGDIDRGGVFAAMFGTLALLEADDQRLISGYVVNKFRGDRSLLEPGLDMLRRVAGRPVLGVVPWLPDLWLDSEDALDIEGRRASISAAGERGADRPLRIAVDLDWLRITGLATAVTERAARGGSILGICGGYQMLGGAIDDADGVEGGSGTGLNLLPVATRFGREKTLRRVAETAYEIHHGVVTSTGPAEAFDGGCRRDTTYGTLWHGLFDNDETRRAFLTEIAEAVGKPPPDSDTSFRELREARLDRLADAIDEHLDTAAIEALVDKGVPDGLPFVPPGAP